MNYLSRTNLVNRHEYCNVLPMIFQLTEMFQQHLSMWKFGMQFKLLPYISVIRQVRDTNIVRIQLFLFYIMILLKKKICNARNIGRIGFE